MTHCPSCGLQSIVIVEGGNLRCLAPDCEDPTLIDRIIDERRVNKLTPAEGERLALLTEELAEAIQAIGKILRHGYESTHPNGGETNRRWLERELGDGLCAVRLMFEAGDLRRDQIYARADEKRKRVAKYLHHQRPKSGGAA